MSTYCRDVYLIKLLLLISCWAARVEGVCMKEGVNMRGGKSRVLEHSRGESMVWRSGGRVTTLLTDTVDGSLITVFELYVEFTALNSDKGTVRGGDSTWR